MRSRRTKIHFFVVEDKSIQQKFRVKLKQINQDNWISFEMQIIEGKSFFEGEEDYLRLLLSETALSYSGIGSTTEMLSNDNIVFHFDIAP